MLTASVEAVRGTHVIAACGAGLTRAPARRRNVFQAGVSAPNDAVNGISKDLESKGETEPGKCGVLPKGPEDKAGPNKVLVDLSEHLESSLGGGESVC